MKSEDERKKEELIYELAGNGDVIPVPPQIKYGISVFAMTDGPPIVHITNGTVSAEDAVTLQELIDLLRAATDNLLFQTFLRNMASMRDGGARD